MQKILLLFLIGFSTIAFPQSVKDLENQRKNALKQLELTGKLLNETKQNEKSTINKLNIINRNISDRKKLIHSINNEIVALDNELNLLDQQKTNLETQIQLLKDDYARLIQETQFQQHTNNILLFIFSADSFEKMFRRVRYLQESANYRKEQVIQIENLQDSISTKNKNLSDNKRTKQDVLDLREREQANLTRNERKERIMLEDLKKKEKQLLTQQKTQQKKASELNQLIEKMIAEEIRKAQEKENAKKGTTSPKEQQKNEAKQIKLTGDFAKNKGKLPWPVNKGFISGRYGIQAHPVIKNITINNKGIYIQTSKDSQAKAVFDGEITQCFSVQGGASAVIVKHGNYRTVYANLSRIFVEEGDIIKLGDPIGQITMDERNDNKTELYFQVWKDKTILNPSEWIIRK